MAHAKDRSAPEESDPNGLLLPGLLMVAVPLWMDRLALLSWEERMQRRDACMAVLATGANEKDCLEGIACLVTGSKGKKGQVAEAFNRLAEALALGALQPGGVTFHGLHFEAGDHPA